jgi:hypothetical protein
MHQTTFHVYPRTVMDAVHAGTASPGPAMSFDAAVHEAARLCVRSPHDVARFASKVRRGRSPRVFIAGTYRTRGYILARADDAGSNPNQTVFAV